MKSLKLVFNICIVVLVFSMYPLIKKVLNKVGWFRFIWTDKKTSDLKQYN